MSILKRITSVIGILSVLLVSGQATADIVDRIVAIVNNEIITLFELNKALLPYVEKIESAGYSDEKKRAILYQLRQDMLSRMVERMLTDQEAANLMLMVSDKEVDNAIERLKSAQFMTREDLEKALEQDGITFEEYREKIRQEILRPKLINHSVKSKVVITDSDVKDFYETHPDEFAGEKKYFLHNILLGNQSHGSDEFNQEQNAPGDFILEMLEKGSDFKTLARQYSQAPNAADGGELGLFSLDSLSEQIGDAVIGLSPGEHTGVLLTDSGYQIFFLSRIEVVGGKTMDQAFDDISNRLYDEIVEEKFRAWLDSLKEKSHIKIML